ncbi:hypothetical protein C9374_011482 [Naegleria lovaniensis]|uniref:Uncharacterized protein n=1 Tax=Naegleria lovaniensis TaxID=51637 RepID=A0AA88H4F2_NAELO|nr:uncharacterized protein C9374_011482 [Naegleria lovaniensis]KAG2392757.1 hypothetical protein C9374_011482 [Naegleria lovaniensis]
MTMRKQRFTTTLLLLSLLCILSFWSWWLNYHIILANSNDLNYENRDFMNVPLNDAPSKTSFSTNDRDASTPFTPSNIDRSQEESNDELHNVKFQESQQSVDSSSNVLDTDSTTVTNSMDSETVITSSKTHLLWLEDALLNQNRPCVAQAVKTELVRNAIQHLKALNNFSTQDEEVILHLLNQYLTQKCMSVPNFFTLMNTQLRENDLYKISSSVDSIHSKRKLRIKQIKQSILYSLLERHSQSLLFGNSTLFTKLISEANGLKDLQQPLGPSLKSTLLNVLSRVLNRGGQHHQDTIHSGSANIIHAPVKLIQALVSSEKDSHHRDGNSRGLPTSCKYILFEQQVFNEAIQFFSKRISQRGREVSLQFYNSEVNPTDVALLCSGKGGRVGNVDLYEELRRWFSGRRHLIDEMIVWQQSFQTTSFPTATTTIPIVTEQQPSTVESSTLQQKTEEATPTIGSEIPSEKIEEPSQFTTRQDHVEVKPSFLEESNVSQQQEIPIYETRKPSISTVIGKEGAPSVVQPPVQEEQPYITTVTQPSTAFEAKDQESEYYATIRPFHKEEPILTHPRMSPIISQFTRTSSPMVSQFPLFHSILDVFTIPLSLKRANSIITFYYLKLVEKVYHMMCLNCAPYQTLSVLHLESPGLEFLAHFVTIFSSLVFLILFVDHLNIISFTLFCFSFLALNVRNLLSFNSLVDVHGVEFPSGVTSLKATTSIPTHAISPSLLRAQFNTPFSLFSLYSSVADKTLFGMMHFLYLPLLSLAFDKKDSSLIFKACILVAASATLMEQVDIVFYTFFKHMALVLLLAGVARHLVTTIGYTLFYELYSLISYDLILDKAIFQIPEPFTEEDRKELSQVAHPKSKVVISIDARDENPLIIEAQAVAESGTASTILHSEIDTNEFENLPYEQKAERRYAEEQIEILEQDLKHNLGIDEEDQESRPSIEMANVLA